MKVSLLFGCLLSLSVCLAPATARAECCWFASVPCEARQHDDARCDGGARLEGHLYDVYSCFSAGIILINPFDPITWLIANIAGEVACSSVTADEVCEPTLPDGDCDDTDGDGLYNLWETTGMDPDGDGNVDVTLPGADPNRLDAFVEIDCLASEGTSPGPEDDHSHCPSAAAMESVVRSFANAPRANPDGTAGIQLHLDTGGLYGAGVVSSVTSAGGVTGTFGDLGGGGTVIAEAGNEVVDWDGAEGWAGTSFYDLKAAAFDGRRALGYRYALFAHQTNQRQEVNDCTSGVAETPGNDLIVSLGGFRDDMGTPCFAVDTHGFSVGSDATQAGAFMHELGHTFGLRHGGDDGVNYKPNYLSAMNYWYWTGYKASPTNPGAAPGGLDYSRLALPELFEGDLDECLGFDSGLLGYGAVDWDRDGTTEGVTGCTPASTTNVWGDVNGDGACVSKGPDATYQSAAAGDDVVVSDAVVDAIVAGPDLTCDTAAAGDDGQSAQVGFVQPPVRGAEDWSRIDFAFQKMASFADGPSADVTLDEPDAAALEAARARASAMLQPQVLVHVGAPATALPGETIPITFQFTNQGHGPGFDAIWSNTDPGGAPATVELGALRVGELHDFATTFTVPADACPMELVDAAVVELEDIVGEVYAVSGTSTTTVLDIVAPTIVLNGPATSTLECGIASYTELGATAHDTCDPIVPVIVGGDVVDADHTGTYVVEYTATDDWANQSVAERLITVADTVAPDLSVAVSPTVLSPPNHAMVEITPAFVVEDACDPAPLVELVSIVSNEPANGSGDGNTDVDIVVDAAGRIFLRAERKGNGNGRIYTLTFTATDAAGNVTTRTATVNVPKGNK